MTKVNIIMSVANISFFIQVALHKNKEAKAERDKKQVKRPASDY